jgi:hypothetical protein
MPLYLDGKKVEEIDSIDVGSGGAISFVGSGLITTTSGNLTLDPQNGYTRIGSTGAPTESLGEDDMFVSGNLQVAGTTFLQGTTFTNNAQTLDDNIRLQFGTGPQIISVFSTTQTNDSFLLATSTASKTFMLVDRNKWNVNHEVPTFANPTLVVYSTTVTNPATEQRFHATQHNNKDAVTIIGYGGLVNEHRDPVELADEASFNLPTGSAGYGTFMIGDGLEYAKISWTAAAVVTLIDASTNVTNTDTLGNFCLFDGGTAVTVKNRLGAAHTVVFDYNYTDSSV